MPARAWTSGEARVKSLPSNIIRPPVGSVSPARQLKNVDLPAPLGPIRPIISPSSTVRSAPATAQKLPNAFETFFASSSMGALPKAWREALPQLVQAAGLKARDQHDDAAVDDEGQAGAAAAELGVHCRLQRNEDQRADQRSEQGAGAAKGCDDDHLHRDENAEAGVWIDEAGLCGIERARRRGERGAQRQRLQFGLSHRNAEATGRALT